ncbi:TPA: phage major capsid protein, P2 family [Yersinia enterocolitica]|uniref:phage major capsid protein, P2 family n=1 Tax=Yersinia enterocolitica TaxID=630 RepID=UPI0005E681CE|nr:phage major capsid protein, P2 family [Yersinia enterocolitica]EKN3385680.1 phage major capsid protein, P2 family [Yersinia enterocolitica]EKN3571402.1 phage major capsid protein, P2 family [Yersinia enterocolitica]EKN3681969.1 phage major capsid protein, P2 family [Yersinia enterocolitica]EKN3767645.1 phage major capsid protein, P2 family [Yersinia enterocolitica]EKN4012091.1 phage major capsid protein, P2 family [Yersinia enterocolitica]
MRNETRDKWDEYLSAQARLNSLPLDRVTKQFTVAPAVAQTLENKIQEASDLLKRINVHIVPEQEGQRVGIGVSSPIASRNTSNTVRREPNSPETIEDNGTYRCEQTNSDTYISYARLDAWAGKRDFKNRVTNQIILRRALDRIMVGFNGLTVAAKSDFATNPLLQDVNIGWLQKYRLFAPQRVMGDVSVSTRDEENKLITKGAYGNLDALAFDAVNSLIDPWYQEDTGLIVICGRKLLADKYFPVLNTVSGSNPHTEALAGQMLVSQKQIGGMQTYRAPHFPANAMMITTFENLSIYVQEGTHRRTIKEEPEFNRVTTYESDNEAFCIEDYGLGCLIEGIKAGEPV